MSLVEALAELSVKTGRDWSDSMLFEIAVRYDITLHAAPPHDALVTVRHIVPGDGMVNKVAGLPWRLAVVYPIHIAQVWQAGESETLHAKGESARRNADEPTEYFFFERPVRVTRENLRIGADAVLRLAAAFAASDFKQGVGEKPDPDGAEMKGAPDLELARVRHSTKSVRRDVLDPVLDNAISESDGDDVAAIYAKLCTLADEGETPPLLASTSRGIKYSKNGSDEYLTRGALSKRLLRRRSAP